MDVSTIVSAVGNFAAPIGLIILAMIGLKVALKGGKKVESAL